MESFVDNFNYYNPTRQKDFFWDANMHCYVHEKRERTIGPKSGGALEVADVTPEIQFKLSRRTDARCAQFWKAFNRSQPSERLEERILGGLELSRVGSTDQVDRCLRCTQHLLVERQNAPDIIADEIIEFGFRNRAIDPSILFGQPGINFVAYLEHRAGWRRDHYAGNIVAHDLRPRSIIRQDKKNSGSETNRAN